MPLLIRGLDLPEFSIRRKVIDTLLAVCEDGSADKGAISEHAPSLVNTMLKNSRLSGTASAVRLCGEIGPVQDRQMDDNALCARETVAHEHACGWILVQRVIRKATIILETMHWIDTALSAAGFSAGDGM